MKEKNERHMRNELEQEIKDKNVSFKDVRWHNWTGAEVANK